MPNPNVARRLVAGVMDAGGDTTPGGAGSAILLENGNGIQLEDGSGVLLLEA